RAREQKRQSALVVRLTRPGRVLAGLRLAGLREAARGVLLVGTCRTFVGELVEAREPLGRQNARLDRGAHRAAGLGAMLAVAEAAVRGKRGDVLESARVAVVHPLRELAHAGRIDPQPVLGGEQLAARRRVPAALV